MGTSNYVIILKVYFCSKSNKYIFICT